MEMDFDEIDNETGTIDVCPSCGILLAHSLTTDGCNDPMGCGDFDDTEYEEDEEEDGLEELNFD